MLGNGSAGAGFNRTAVGIRGLTTVTPTTTNRSQKKKKTEDGGRIDRVDRDDESNAMLMEFAEPEEDEKEEKLAAPAGHSTSMVRFTDDAFRTDKAGRQIPPTFSDVDQGNLGDAWLLASCAAVAHAKPTALLKRIRRNLNDSWTIKLGKDEYRVEPEFPNEGYADPMPNGQNDTLWVALVEKAFAQASAESYANLECGNPARALDLLTGRRARRQTITATLPPELVFERLQEGRRASAPMVVRTHVARVGKPLTGDHYYAVLDAYEKDGVKHVRLYNPWGTKSNSRPLEEVMHDVMLDALLNDCDALFIGG